MSPLLCQWELRKVPEGDASKIVTGRNENSDRHDKMKQRFIFIDQLF